MAISKLLDKVSQAKSAVESVKGIKTKLKNIDKTTVLDQLGEQAEEAKRTLEKRRTSLEKNLDARNKGKVINNFVKDLDKIVREESGVHGFGISPSTVAILINKLIKKSC